MVYKFHPMSVISSGNWQLSAEIVRIYWAIPSLLHITAHLTSYNIWRLPQEIWLPDPNSSPDKLQHLKTATGNLIAWPKQLTWQATTFEDCHRKSDSLTQTAHLTSYNIWRLPQEIWLPDPNSSPDKLQHLKTTTGNLIARPKKTPRTCQIMYSVISDHVCVWSHHF